ncbi:MAG: flagellar basal-body MS-ring/collar protein FliF [Thermodesulfobacteriota bacterium]|nr:flagellar basal-body MS-ring/collar protein FliF [Thermodesulfobacteriota bacterium]
MSSHAIDQIGTLFKNLTPAKMITLLCLVTITVAGFIFLLRWTGQPDYQLLYSNLDSNDAGAIVAKLKESKIPYQISSNGTAILVAKEVIYETRLELASQGLPRGSGVGFEIFDNTKLGMTEFVQNVNYQRAVQGELSRTINGFAEVDSSRVHIVVPPKSLFIKDQQPATASVVLTLCRGRRLNGDQVQGIIHLVSSSVSGLSPENVTVVDNHGKMFTGLKPDFPMGQASSGQLDFQQKLEKTYEDRVKTMLETALGHGKAIVRVSSTMDFRRYEKTEEMYHKDNQVVRSEQLLSEASNATLPTPMGVPGVVSNLSENNAAASADTQNPSSQKQDRTINYEIGKVTSHTVDPVGTLKKISVAVLVDGTTKLVQTGEEGEEEWKYFPRTQEEMAKLEGIVKRAVNFDSERGDEIEVVNIPFETSDLAAKQGEETPAEASWFTVLKGYASFIKYGALVLFVLLSYLFVVRPLVQWLTSTNLAGAHGLAQLPGATGQPEGAHAQAIKTLPLQNQLLQMMSADKQGSVDALRSWLKES